MIDRQIDRSIDQLNVKVTPDLIYQQTKCSERVD